MVGATNHAVYDIYADYADIRSDDGVKRIEYKKFKKLVEHLLGDAERSTLILNNAPEKLYLIGPATIILKTMFKRFGVRHIVVSDRGVKEGYLQLVLEGKESGMYCDLQENTLGGTPREATAEPAKQKKNKSEKKSKEGETEKSPAKEEAKEEGCAEKTEESGKKRGRPKKQAADGSETSSK